MLVTVALGIGLAKIRDEQRARGETTYQAVVDLLTVGFELLMRVLLWVVALVPLAVFGVVATSLAREGFELFLNLGWFIVVVLAGLACQVTWYLGQLGRLRPDGAAAVPPGGGRRDGDDLQHVEHRRDDADDARRLDGQAGRLPRVEPARGLRRHELQQRRHRALSGDRRALLRPGARGRAGWSAIRWSIVLTTLVASVGAGGIPSGSFVTMPLIFAAVNLPADKLPILLTIDWFLDRCRTTSNVLGDMTVAVLLERTADKPAE